MNVGILFFKDVLVHMTEMTTFKLLALDATQSPVPDRQGNGPYWISGS